MTFGSLPNIVEPPIRIHHQKPRYLYQNETISDIFGPLNSMNKATDALSMHCRHLPASRDHITFTNDPCRQDPCQHYH